MLQLLMINWYVHNLGDLDHIEYTVDSELNLRITSYFVQSLDTADELYKKHFYAKMNKEDMKRIAPIVDLINKGLLDSSNQAKEGEAWVVTNYDSFNNVIHRMGPVYADSSNELQELIGILDRYMYKNSGKKIV